MVQVGQGRHPAVRTSDVLTFSVGGSRCGGAAGAVLFTVWLVCRYDLLGTPRDCSPEAADDAAEAYGRSIRIKKQTLRSCSNFR